MTVICGGVHLIKNMYAFQNVGKLSIRTITLPSYPIFQKNQLPFTYHGTAVHGAQGQRARDADKGGAC